MTLRAVAAAGVALALALSGCSADTSIELDVPAQVEGSLPEATVAELQSAVEAAMTATASTGAIVGVWAPWSGSWVTAFGTSTPGGAAVTTDMEFRAGRITRAMTCDVLYNVAATGAVSLDDSITEYVSGLPDLGDVTLEMLCDSTSGVGSYLGQLQKQWTTNPTRVWNAMELAGYGLGQFGDTEPGAGYRDSDAGYLLLGIALERATRTSMADLMEQYIFEPLDMEATRLPGPAAGPASDELPVLSGLHSIKNGEDGAMNCAEPLDLTVASSSLAFTDSGVVTDVNDLARYMQALGAQALVPDGVDRFADPVPTSNDASSWYTTIGGTVQAGSLVGHFGASLGYLTSAWVDPSTGMTVVAVLNNSAVGSTAARNLGWQLAAIASKAPAASGQTAPEAGLPFTAEQWGEAITSRPLCPASEG
ncbi:serine hydrolase domain-containing protein [Microbacterium awajiense]|uniref:Serine hydrolase domain-containing protein n=1 Tax=Microbacterium awajiense TaxID=415214 RepID=A0ABP7AQE2_9MICO